MKRWAGLVLGCVAAGAQAVPTPITVKVVAKSAKLVGDPAGGASVVIRDAMTGTVLASGTTQGSSGDTAALVERPIGRFTKWSTPGDAKFTAVIDLKEPRKITVEAGSPGAGAYGGSSASQTQWVLPGKSPNGVNGWVVELPGMMIDIDVPARHAEVPAASVAAPAHPIQANIVMMCGCPVSAGGLWDPAGWAVDFTVTRDAAPVQSGRLTYGGKPNLFTGSFDARAVGVYKIFVTAFDPVTGNAGVAETTFEVDPPGP